MIQPDLRMYVAVVSTGRSSNVSSMQKLIGPATWYVGRGEHEDYLMQGASLVKEVGSLCASRNAALYDAWNMNLPCVQVSDDLCRIQGVVYDPDQKKMKVVRLSFEKACSTIYEEMLAIDARLGGVAPTDNPLNFSSRRPVKTSHFIVGDFLVTLPCGVLFDEAFTLKEDYDYTLQHLMRYGVVARCDSILAEFKHRTNIGGAVDVRTSQLEEENIALLKSKWRRYIVDNPKRPHEVLLRWERSDVSHSMRHR